MNYKIRITHYLILFLCAPACFALYRCESINEATRFQEEPCLQGEAQKIIPIKTLKRPKKEIIKENKYWEKTYARFQKQEAQENKKIARALAKEAKVEERKKERLHQKCLNIEIKMTALQNAYHANPVLSKRSLKQRERLEELKLTHEAFCRENL